MKKILIVLLTALAATASAQSVDKTEAGNGDAKSAVSSATKEYLPPLEFVPIYEIVVGGVTVSCSCDYDYCPDMAFSRIRRIHKSELDYFETKLRKTFRWSVPELELEKIVWVVRYGNDMVVEEEPSETLQLILTEDEQ